MSIEFIFVLVFLVNVEFFLVVGIMGIILVLDVFLVLVSVDFSIVEVYLCLSFFFEFMLSLLYVVLEFVSDEMIKIFKISFVLELFLSEYIVKFFLLNLVIIIWIIFIIFMFLLFRLIVIFSVEIDWNFIVWIVLLL